MPADQAPLQVPSPKPGMFVWYGRFKNRAGIVTKVFKDDKGTLKVEVEPVPKGRKKPKTRNILPYRPMNEEDSAKFKKIYDEETKKLRERKKSAQLQALKVAARFSVTASRGVSLELDDFLRSIRDGIEDLQSSSEGRAAQRNEPVTYTAEEAEKDIRMWQAEAQKAFDALGRSVESAVRGLPNWAGSNVTLRAVVDKSSGAIDWFGDEPKLRITGEVFVHEGSTWRNQPSFTAFSNEQGDIHGIGDVLDAGDSDFFHDPMVEADYFSLTEELRNPGRARSQGNKVITLYTARPKKDRHLYDGAKHIPNNVFLSTSEDEAYGYSRDLGGDRDVYMIRIKRMYLIETLQSGSLRNYQSFNGQGSSVPVQSSELIHEGEALKVTAWFHQAFVLPPRELLRYVGKFETEYKRAVDKLSGSFPELAKAVKKYRDGELASDKLLHELGLRLISFPRELLEELRNLSWAIGDFHANVKQRKITRVRNMDTLPAPLAREIEKVLARDSKFSQLMKAIDPQKVKQVLADPDYDYKWDEKYEEGVSPEVQAALAELYSAGSGLQSLLERTEKQLTAFVTGDLQPEKIETLYHASVKARQIYQNGFSAEVPKHQIGLGGSQSTKSGTGISFTYDLKAALDIARSFKEVAMIAVGDIKASTILDWGVRESEMDDFLLHLKHRLEKSGYKQRVTIDREGGRWVVKEDDEESRMVEKGIDQIFKTPEAVFEVYDAYLWSHRTRLNPVHMNRNRLINFLKTADPKDIGVVSAQVDMTNPEISTFGGEREYRVPPAAVIEVTRLYQ